MNPKEYCSYYLKEFDNYIKSVLNGKRTVGKLERQAVERWQNLYLKKYYFDQQEFEKRIKFCSLINVKSVIEKGQVTQLRLACWQLLTLAHYSLYLKKGSDEKVIQTISLSFSGKNGKTSLGVLCSLMACLIDRNRINANIPIVCVSQKQANQALDYFKQIIKASPAIQPFFKILHSTIVYTTAETTNKIFILTNDSEKIQALEVAISIIDEIYLFDSEESTVLDVIRSKQSTTFNPVNFFIGTFSDKEKHNYENYYIPCTNILDGLVEDDSHFILFCSQDDETEIDNPDTWIKSNPSLGVVKDLQSLIKAYDRTKIFPASLATFRTENLNYWKDVSNEAGFLTDEYVNNAMRNTEPIEPGSNLIIGFDGSLNTDVYSLALMTTVPNPNSIVGQTFKFQILNFVPNNPKAWLKNDIQLERWFVQNLARYKANGYLPDERYNPKGYIIKAETPTQDTDQLFQIITGLSKTHIIESLNYDSYNAGVLISKCINRGINCNVSPQGVKYQNEPLKLIESMIINDYTNKDNPDYQPSFQILPNPFVKWQQRNLLLRIDQDNNYKLVKRSKKGVPLTIDSWSSILNCVQYWLTENKDQLAGKGFALDNFKQLK